MSAPGPLADEAARSLVTTGGLDRTLFVEAGAGTGKTTQLVERIASLVLDDGVPVTELAAITFTEAAAAELRTRIRVRLERAGREGPDERSRRARAAVADLDRASVSTLHGFAHRLLAEVSVEAGLPPRLRVADEITSELAREERWERFVDGLYDDPADEELLTRAALVGVDLEPRYRGQVTLKQVAAELDQSWDRLEDTPPVDAGLSPLDFAPFDDAVEALDAFRSTCLDPSDNLCARLDEAVPPLLDVVGIADPHQKLRSVKGAVIPRVGNFGKKANWSDVRSVRQAAVTLADARDTVVGRVADEVLGALLVRVADEVLAAARARQADGQLEFHDLLVLARRVLRERADVRRRLHDRYRCLLLDEFQDTDPLQIELAVLIAGAVGDDRPGPWHQLPVASGRLFFVGDPKQSIYRFRRADIGLFLCARSHFGRGDDLVLLSTNFRTVEPVLAWVNAVFGGLMEAKDGSQPAYEPLAARRHGGPADVDVDHRPLLLGGPHDDLRAAALREVEAAEVAAVVADVRDRPGAWPVHDDSAGGWRPAMLADVTILVPTRLSLPFLRDALDERSVPYRLDSGSLVYDTQEVRDVLAAVRAVDDPTDRLAVVAALRSPLFACADTDLFTFRQAGGTFDVRYEPPAGLPADHPVPSALAYLRELWEQRWWTAPSVLLGRLLTDRHAGLLAFGAVRPGALPRDIWHRLRFLVDQARAFEEAGGDTSVRAFLDWAELQSSETARVHEPVLPETDHDAVRIMTVHGAKGLEFPITVLSGLTTKPAKPQRGVQVTWPDDGPPDVKLRKGVQTVGYEPRADLEAAMDADEKLRLLYVACTRARDHLVVSGHHRATDGSYGCRLWEASQQHADLARIDPAVPSDTGPSDTGPDDTGPGGTGSAGTGSATDPGEPVPGAEAVQGELDLFGSDPGVGDDRDGWVTARERLLAPQRTSRVLSATALAASLSGADPGDPADRGSPDDPDDPGGPAHPGEPDDEAAGASRRRGRAGTAVGRAVHATLQLTDLGAVPADPATHPADPHPDPGTVPGAGDPVDVLSRHQAEIEAIPDLADTVAALARSALRSEAVALARAHPHRRELYVAAPVGERVIEGYVDLLIETPHGLVVVDYKTDAVSSEAEIDAKLATYELQGAAYAVALEAATGLTVADCRFVFCHRSGPVERSVADLPGAMARVRAWLESGSP